MTLGKARAQLSVQKWRVFLFETEKGLTLKNTWKISLKPPSMSMRFGGVFHSRRMTILKWILTDFEDDKIGSTKSKNHQFS